jgi:hypothetical protein
LKTLESRLFSKKLLIEKYHEKASNHSLLKKKLQDLNKNRKFLEKELNFLIKIEASNEIRSKSVPRNTISHSPGFRTERFSMENNEIIESNHEKMQNSPIEEGKFEAKVEFTNIEKKCPKDCSKHQKKFKFNIENASFNEIELFDNVRSRFS